MNDLTITINLKNRTQLERIVFALLTGSDTAGREARQLAFMTYESKANPDKDASFESPDDLQYGLETISVPMLIEIFKALSA